MQQNNVIYNNPSNLDQRLLSIQTLEIPTQSTEGFIDTVLPGFPANNIAIANNTNASLFIVSRVIDYIPKDAVEVGPFETRSFPIMTSTEFRVFYRGLVSEEKNTINVFLSNQTIPLFGAKFNPNDEALSVTVVGGEIALLPGDEHIGNVAIDAPLPEGTNHIGSVTAELELTDPLPSGTNHIGSVTVDNANPIAVTGDVTATIDTSAPLGVVITNPLPVGTNTIGRVEIANSQIDVNVTNDDSNPASVDVVNEVYVKAAPSNMVVTVSGLASDPNTQLSTDFQLAKKIVIYALETNTTNLGVGGLDVTPVNAFQIPPGGTLELEGIQPTSVFLCGISGTAAFSAIIMW